MIMILVACIKGTRGIILSPTAVEYEYTEGDTFADLFRCVTLRDNLSLSTPELALHLDQITKITVRSTSCATSPSPSNGIELSSVNLPLSFCNDIQSKYVEYMVNTTLNEQVRGTDHNNNDISAKKNAFTAMLEAQRKTSMPPKPDKAKLTAPDKLYSDLIDWASQFDQGWTSDMMESGKTVFSKLSKALWYIDHNHDKFERGGCPIPKVFKQFSNYNNYAKNHHLKPVITQEKLHDVCIELTKCISLPSMMTKDHKMLHDHIESLLQTMIKYKERLENDNKRHQTLYQTRREPARNVASDSSCALISPKEKIDDMYRKLDDHIHQCGLFEVVELDQFSPDDRYKRRKFVQNLHLTVPVMMFRMAYGGNIGTLSFIWSVPNETSTTVDERNTRVIAQISTQMPKYSTRAMRRDFINKYAKFVKTPKSILRHMYFELTSTEPFCENSNVEKVDEHIQDVLLADDPQLLLDYRSLNGKKVDEKFQLFFAEMGKYFDEQMMPVNERRHGNELYFPFAISVEDLKNEIAKRLPENTPMPSTETIRLQFMPSSQFSRTSLKYTGQFNVKYQVQTRQGRVHHPDARYVATLFRYMKEFCVKYRDHAMLVCLDDKAIVPVGEPGVHISTGVRGHNRVLGPAEGACLVAADHDFHVGGTCIVPSVTLVVDIPNNSNDSFFQGKVFVTSKDKVFEASTPFRHATELVRALRDHFSDNSVDLKKPILCIMTDGGPDHRLTFESVKTSLLQIFLQLDLDLLIAARTAPNHSWMNPAERCMSLLNYALQHVALSRDEMPEEFEQMIKHKSSLNAIRNCVSKKPGLKQAFANSMDPMLSRVNDRFMRMKLKGEAFSVYRGVTDEDIDEGLTVVANVCHSEDLTRESSSKDIKGFKNLQDFLRCHSTSTHYSFQIMKCRGESVCPYCTISPMRLNADLVADLSFLPCPVPDEGGDHYSSFQELYGTELTDKYRPSLQNNTEFADEDVEADKMNRELLKTGKARDVLHCAECKKPRLIYSHSKLTRDQEEMLRRLREDEDYTCGGSMVPDCGFVTKRCISCVSEVEVAYYSASLKHYLPPCCLYCGDQDNLLDDTHEYIEKLYEDFSVVRPLCIACRNKGLDAKTWGKKFFKKRRA